LRFEIATKDSEMKALARVTLISPDGGQGCQSLWFDSREDVLPPTPKPPSSLLEVFAAERD
jgi:hypothetical protein